MSIVEAAVISAIVILAAVDHDHAVEFNRNVMLPVACCLLPGPPCLAKRSQSGRINQINPSAVDVPTPTRAPE